MVYMKITKTAKKELTPDEERDRIFGNLKRMRQCNMFKHNHINEYHNKKIVEICGIDNSGANRLFSNTDYMIKDMVKLGVLNDCYEECDLRNYAVIIMAIKEFIGLNNIEKHMQFNDFRNIYLTISHTSSVDICHKILNIIKKRMILEKIENETE